MYKYLQLPDSCSAEQAWAVLEFLYQLEELVWDAYHDPLMTLIGPDPPEPADPDPLLDLDADPPF